MRSQKQLAPFWYALTDYCTAAIAWGVFYFFRKYLLHQPLITGGKLATDNQFWLGVLSIPLGWLALFTATGAYLSIYRKSRVGEFNKTAFTCFMGAVVLFFLFLIDDAQDGYAYYFKGFIALLLIHLFFIFLGRLLILNKAKRQLLTGSIQFPALLVGTATEAEQLYRETKNKLKEEGYVIVGYVSIENPAHPSLSHLYFPLPKKIIRNV